MIEKPYAESKKSSNPVPSTCAHPASKIARDFAAAVALGGGGGGEEGGCSVLRTCPGSDSFAVRSRCQHPST